MLIFHLLLLVITHFPGSISTAEGSALVKLGNTTVVCGVKAVKIILEPINWLAQLVEH